MRTRVLPQAEAVSEPLTHQPEVVSIVQKYPTETNECHHGTWDEDAIREDVPKRSCSNSRSRLARVRSSSQYRAGSALSTGGWRCGLGRRSGRGCVRYRNDGFSLAAVRRSLCHMKSWMMRFVMAKENAGAERLTDIALWNEAAEKIMPRWKEESIQPDVIIIGSHRAKNRPCVYRCGVQQDLSASYM